MAKDKFEFNQLIKDNDDDTSLYIRVAPKCNEQEKELCVQNAGISLDKLGQEYLDFIGVDKDGNITKGTSNG